MFDDPAHPLALAIGAGYAAYCGLVAWRWRRRSRPAPATATGCLVAYASQTGFAEQVAQRTAEALERLGMTARIANLRGLDAAALEKTRQALFVVSTTGDGEAPDDARPFQRAAMAKLPDLSGMNYGVLALGDRRYDAFCAFGRSADAWLRGSSAVPLFPMIEVDDGDTAALQRWQEEVGRLAGAGGAADQIALPDRAAPGYEDWRLVERRLLNPGSLGEAAYHIALAPAGALTPWQAGDIVTVAPRNPPAAVQALLARLGLPGEAEIAEDDRTTLAEALATRHLPAETRDLAGLAPAALVARLPGISAREYSIASLPGDGRIELLVRRMRHDDGRLGIGSGWLTAHAAEGGTIALRIRRNEGFHPPPDDRPMLLIGNGSGLAGLRAHLKARAAAGHTRNWLVFGERMRGHDYFHGEEIDAWHAAGVIRHLDLAFSRDQPDRIYVQDLLRARAARLREWVAAGASIYVCGSLKGMARGVHEALETILGRDTLAGLADADRYRRDVY